MSEPLVTVNSVSKKFCRSLRRSLWYGVMDMSSELVGQNNNRSRLRKEEFWAVRDISFHVNEGETLGLIGHNGAGKTSILKMLNGLIKPDEGSITVKGRLQALIALGAGFNPVLSGRENIYINASVLGFSKRDIDKKYDQIVAFSGIEEFIDMPVQNYSSGMAVRLGFSVAAHLEPDILLVDEVLAVGDLAFRTKCQVRIQELRNNGVAIILVSHNLHTISHVCSRAIALEKGQILYDGETESAIDVYRTSLIKHNNDAADSIRGGTGEIRIDRVEVLDQTQSPQNEYAISDSCTIRIHYTAYQHVQNPVFNITINILNGDQVTGLRTDMDGQLTGNFLGQGNLDIHIPNLNLLPNIYTIDAVIFHQDGYTFYDRVNKINYIKIRGGLPINGTAYLPHTWVVPDPDSIRVGE